ncbi:hypothetical protein C8R44DRAFT_213594 [Mycena epipterygia]|nr:hypothetical protein C8R44DRAFT_213594 [Mycena epipterygia]
MALLQPVPSPAFTNANTPFSGETEVDAIPADLILRTADSVDFHVHKAIISFVSPVFRDMLGFEPDEFKNGTPIVRVHEPSEALEILLPICYPFLPNSQPATLGGVESALNAAEKYQIPAAVEALQVTLITFVDTQPYQVFGIALRRGLVDAVNAAALATLEEPFLSKRNDMLEFQPGLMHQGLQILTRLHDFRTACGTQAVKLSGEYKDWIFLDDVSIERCAVWWDCSAQNGHGDGCGATVESAPDTSNAPSLLYPAAWFVEHMNQVVKAVEICPTEKHIRMVLLDMKGTMYDLLSKCSMCSKRAKTDLEEFVVDELVRKVVAHNLEVVRNINFILD